MNNAKVILDNKFTVESLYDEGWPVAGFSGYFIRFHKTGTGTLRANLKGKDTAYLTHRKTALGLGHK